MAKLSLADLEGSTLVAGPPDPKPAGRLTAADLEGSEVVGGDRPAVDMSPAARRARSGQAPGPREMTSEEAGTSAGMTRGILEPTGVRHTPERGGEMIATIPRLKNFSSVAEPAPTDVDGGQARYNVLPGGVTLARPEEGGPPDSAFQPGLDPNRRHRLKGELLPQFAAVNKDKFYQLDQFEIDPIAQTVIAGRVGRLAGEAAAPALGKFGAQAARIGVPAVEGAAASKTLGGDPTTGAAIGAAVPILGSAFRAAARGAAGGGNRLVTDVTKGKVRPAQALREELGRGNIAAGEPALKEVIKETPEARYAIEVQARTNPAKATKTLDKVITKATDATDVDMAKIQQQHGGVPLVSVTDRLGRLQTKLNEQGDGVAADAVGRFRNDLLKRYATSGKVTPDMDVSPELKLGAQQIRRIRNNVGDTAFGGGYKDIEANTRKGAAAKMHAEINAAIEEVAAETGRVDVKALKLRNKQIATLIPVRDALQDRVDLAIDTERSLFQKAKGVPGNAARRGARELDYRLGEGPAGAPPAEVLGALSRPGDQ